MQEAAIILQPLVDSYLGIGVLYVKAPGGQVEVEEVPVALGADDEDQAVLVPKVPPVQVVVHRDVAALNAVRGVRPDSAAPVGTRDKNVKKLINSNVNDRMYGEEWKLSYATHAQDRMYNVNDRMYVDDMYVSMPVQHKTDYSMRMTLFTVTVFILCHSTTSHAHTFSVPGSQPGCWPKIPSLPCRRS